MPSRFRTRKRNHQTATHRRTGREAPQRQSLIIQSLYQFKQHATTGDMSLYIKYTTFLGVVPLNIKILTKISKILISGGPEVLNYYRLTLNWYFARVFKGLNWKLVGRERLLYRFRCPDGTHWEGPTPTPYRCLPLRCYQHIDHAIY